jgi:hypothetical protein
MGSRESFVRCGREYLADRDVSKRWDSRDRRTVAVSTDLPLAARQANQSASMAMRVAEMPKTICMIVSSSMVYEVI